MQCGKNLKGKYLLEITHSAKNLNGNPLTYKVFNYLQHLDPLTPKSLYLWYNLMELQEVAYVLLLGVKGSTWQWGYV